MKRVFDVVLSVVSLILLSPVFLVTMVLIRVTSPGPVFYLQERVGKGKKLFVIYKFRTMLADAEKNTGPIWATQHDSRVTSIGAFLRKSHLDEIPQFINVIKGEMSIVGPRPERPTFVEQLKNQLPNYEKRLEVLPGITGLAQIRHRYDTNFGNASRKIRYDTLYIQKRSFWVDLGILLKTVRVIFTAVDSPLASNAGHARIAKE